MPSIFTRIIQREIPAEILSENDRFLAILDVRPTCRGHSLVIPKQEIDYVFDMPDALLSEMLVFAKPVAAAIKKVCPCKKIGLMVVGIEVPHVHLHMMPINAVADMSFANAKPGVPAELKALGDQIRALL